MLDVLHRSHRGRVCVSTSGDASVRTPYVISTDHNEPVFISADRGRVLNLFGTEVRMDAKVKGTFPEPVDDRTISADIDGDPGGMTIIPNGFEMRNDFRLLAERISEIRTEIGNNSLMYLSGAVDPSNLALLSYMGVDVFDDSLARAYGINGIRCTPEGLVVTGDDETENNIAEMRRECEKVMWYTEAGRLRELVDQRASSSPFNVALLRTFDRSYFEYQEGSCSTIGDRFSCNTTQSLYRPDVKRFRERMIAEYVKPAHKKVLVLLPCSAKKPYHTSKTHRAFSSAIHTGPHDVHVHEVIVTSPLGTVPRELDIFYPANSYDIPVTGEWKCQEREFIREMVKNIIDQGYETVISHLGKDTELVSDLADMVETVVGDATSPASLRNLETEVRNAAKQYGEGSYSTDRIESIRSILGYQFGREIADVLMNGSHVTGKFPYWKIFNGKEQIGMLTPERQMVSLTLAGAQMLADTGRYVVNAKEFEIKGNIFAIGVDDADENIRVGDEAVVLMNGAVKAIGVAAMSGREMKELQRGIAVKVRHKSK